MVISDMIHWRHCWKFQELKVFWPASECDNEAISASWRELEWEEVRCWLRLKSISGSHHVTQGWTQSSQSYFCVFDDKQSFILLTVVLFSTAESCHFSSPSTFCCLSLFSNTSHTEVSVSENQIYTVWSISFYRKELHYFLKVNDVVSEYLMDYCLHIFQSSICNF